MVSGSQFSVDNKGIIWSQLLVLVMTLAAALWTNWSLLMYLLEHSDSKVL